LCVTYVCKSRSLEVTAADTERSATNDFPLEITGLGLYRAPILSRTVSEINGNFRRK